MIPVGIFSLVVAICITLPTVLCWRWWVQCNNLTMRNDNLQRQVNAISEDRSNALKEVRRLRELIGAPDDVVFLPEKTYWDDRRFLSEQNETFRKRLSEQGKRLAAISKLLETDGCSGTYINPILTIIDTEK